MENDFKLKGARLLAFSRVMSMQIIVFCIIYVVSLVSSTIGSAISQRDTDYAETVADYEYTVSIWDAYLDSYSVEEVVEAIGERPTLPEKPNIPLNLLFEICSKVFLVVVFALFACAVLYSFGCVNNGIHQQIYYMALSAQRQVCTEETVFGEMKIEEQDIQCGN